jgi:micrococcal nuclease
VIDGDTLDVEVGGTALRVRAYGFDTPESGEPCYEEALDRLDELVNEGVLLLADARLEDPGGRQLRYLYTPDGLLIDAVMVAEGYAEAWRADGSLRDMLRGLDREARDGHVGCLWSE